MRSRDRLIIQTSQRIQMAKKQKTNFTFEIDHPETAAPQAIQASVVGQKGLLTFKAVEINELTPCKTNFVFEIQHLLMKKLLISHLK